MEVPEPLTHQFVGQPVVLGTALPAHAPEHPDHQHPAMMSPTVQTGPERADNESPCFYGDPPCAAVPESTCSSTAYRASILTGGNDRICRWACDRSSSARTVGTTRAWPQSPV